MTKRLRDTFVILLIGLIALIQFHWLEISSGLTHMTGDKGDSRLVVYLFEHLWLVLRGEAEFLSPGIFYPAKGTLGYSEAFIGYEPIYAFFRLIGFAPYRAAILNFITWDFLGYLAATALIRRAFHTSGFPAAIGGALYAFSSAKLNQLNHLQLQPVAFPPLILLSLFSAYERRRELSERALFLRFAIAALLLDLQLVSCFYFGWFTSFWLFLLGMVWGAQTGYRTLARNLISFARQHKPACSGAILVLAIGLIPFLRIYLPVVREFGTRGYSEVFSMVPGVSSYFLMGPENGLWGWLDPLVRQIHEPPLVWEQRIGIGLVLGAFWIFLTATAVRFARGKQVSPQWHSFFSARSVSPAFMVSLVLSIGIFALLALKYAPRVSPWVLVYHLFPGASGVRAVARFTIFIILPLGALFAAWIDQIGRKSRWIGLLGVLALLEQQGGYTGFDAAKDWQRIEALARTLPLSCESFYVHAAKESARPSHELQIDAMLVSAASGIPTLNGYSGQVPNGWTLEPKSSQSDEARAQAEHWLRSRGISAIPCELPVSDS